MVKLTLCCWFFVILKLLVLEYSADSLLRVITNNSLQIIIFVLTLEQLIADMESAENCLYFSWERLAHHQKWLLISSAIVTASFRAFTNASIASILCIAPWITDVLWTNAVHVEVVFVFLKHLINTLEMLNEGTYEHWISSACVSVIPCAISLCYFPPRR